MAVDLTKDIVIRADAPDAEQTALFEKAGIKPVAESELQALQLDPFGATGLWPGIRRPPTVEGRGDETASASREPWVDANGYRAAYLRALEKPPVLYYKPDNLGDRVVPFDSLELALIEAWVAGGNYILALEANYREALQRNDAKAAAAWQQLGRTVRWLQSNSVLFRQPALPFITAIVDAAPASAEIANLLYRRNASPTLASVSAPPAVDPGRLLALVGANLRAPSPESIGRILGHAEAGSAVIVASPAAQQWWRVPALKPVRSDPDREVFSLGKGQVIAYKRPVADPSEFALDVIDIVTHRKRAVRLWNAPSVIALATTSPKSGERLVHLVNYGSPVDTDLQARVQGHYTRATLLRPDGDPIKLTPAKRATMTEVQVPELKRLGVLVFG